MAKHHNFDYSSNTPKFAGDRYYTQDWIRDFWYCINLIGKLGLDRLGVSQFLFGLTTGVVTKGSGDTLNITAVVGYLGFPTKLPNDYTTFPPTTTDITTTVRVSMSAQTNTPVVGGQIDDNHYANAVLDGSTVNYVKLAYKEIDAETRTRAKKTGSYAYQKTTSYELRIEPVAPTTNEIGLVSFVGTSGGAFTITDLNPNRLPLSSEFAQLSQVESIAAPGHAAKMMTVSPWVCPIGVTTVFYIIIGAGGGGGGGGGGGAGDVGVATGGSGGGGGGGAGGEVRFGVMAVVPGTSYPVTVGVSSGGSGGNGGTAPPLAVFPPQNGSNGGGPSNSTMFGITAAGGVGGSGGSCGTTASGSPGSGGAGGAGAAALTSDKESYVGGAGGNGSAGNGGGSGINTMGASGAGGGGGSAPSGIGAADGNSGGNASGITAGVAGTIKAFLTGDGGAGASGRAAGFSSGGANAPATPGIGAGGGGGGGANGGNQITNNTTGGGGGDGGGSVGGVLLIY